MPPSKPPYPPEFRREAVQLARSAERSIAQVARDLGATTRPCTPGSSRPTLSSMLVTRQSSVFGSAAP